MASVDAASARLRRYAPIVRFSSTVILGNNRRPSGTCAMPSPTISCGASPISEVLSKRRLPPPGLTRPVSARRLVVLPAPFAPMRLTMEPAGTWKDSPFTASTVP